MAVVLNPALSMAASGTVGALNYTRWRGRAVARGAYKPVSPQTSAQIASQAVMAGVVSKWHTLTATEVAKWKRVAEEVGAIDRLGQKYIPSAYQLFCSWQCMRQLWGDTWDNSPQKQQLVNILSLTVSSPLGGVIRYQLVPQDFTLPIWHSQYWVAGPYNSQNRRPIDGEYRVMRYAPGRAQFQTSGFEGEKWYWVKARPVQICGRAGEWWEEQVKTKAIS